MKTVTHSEFFEKVGKLVSVIDQIGDETVTIFIDDNSNVVGKATWVYPETKYELV